MKKKTKPVKDNLVDVPMMTPPTKRWKGADTNVQKPKKKKKGK
jgi:hypothetical protein